MKRIEFLITKVRKSTDTRTANGVLDDEIIDYFNVAQNLIQSEILSVDERPNIFLKEVFINAGIATEFYDLPVDMFAENALFMVEAQSNSNVSNYYPLRKIDPTEKKQRTGYYVQNKQISFSPYPNDPVSSKWKVTYFTQLPLLDKRRGTIASFVSGASVTLTAGYDATLDTVDDHFCVVDKDGTIIQANIPMTSFNSGTGVISTTATLTISNGQYIVMGKNSSTNTALPDMCEFLLLDLVRQRIYTRDASQVGKNQAGLTAEQKAVIRDIFSNHTYDVSYPPTTDTDFLGL